MYSAVRPFLRRCSHLLRDHGLNALSDGALTPVGPPPLHNRSDRPVRSVVSRELSFIRVSFPSVSVRMRTLILTGEAMKAGCGSSMKSTPRLLCERTNLRQQELLYDSDHPSVDGSEDDVRSSHLQRVDEPIFRSTAGRRIRGPISKILRCRFSVPMLQPSSISCLFVNTELERGTAIG